MYEVESIDPDSAGMFEALGTKRKFWFLEGRKLFKSGRPGTGEDWAEVVCAKLAGALGIPHAEYTLARSGEVKGVCTPNFVPRDGRLVLGNELVISVPGSQISRSARRQDHRIGRIAALMSRSSLRTPLDWEMPSEVQGALGTFAAYLMLDALVGNQDRHEENWGFIAAGGEVYLAPTFDHASSLGRNESEALMRRKLASASPMHGMHGYTARARSQIFANDGSFLTTHDAFHELSQACRESAHFWIRRLEQISGSQIEEILARVPAEWISETSREFAKAIIVENRKSLLESTL